MVEIPKTVIVGLEFIDSQPGNMPFRRAAKDDIGPFRFIGVCMTCGRIYFDVRLPTKEDFHFKCPWHHSTTSTDVRRDHFITYRNTILYAAKISQKIVNIDKLEEGMLHAAIR